MFVFIYMNKCAPGRRYLEYCFLGFNSLYGCMLHEKSVTWNDLHGKLLMDEVLQGESFGGNLLAITHYSTIGHFFHI